MVGKVAAQDHCCSDLQALVPCQQPRHAMQRSSCSKPGLDSAAPVVHHVDLLAVRPRLERSRTRRSSLDHARIGTLLVSEDFAVSNRPEEAQTSHFVEAAEEPNPVSVLAVACSP